ncbi:hypothetical protein [Candidatus Accumulibacter sp. ACC003]|jgi:hypothetical protein|uniref:hypothetical protein n=1 Tax=Candidatus Accumulibacter sp. ACC003 TaxID=2823334 RepID=UPI0025BC7E2D|nr:hypothetical protein [Candidatus Accumulibacter sp. ACC003]
MQRPIEPLQASLAAIGTSIENRQRSPSHGEFFIVAMNRSPPTMDGSIDGVQAPTHAVQMPDAQVAESKRRGLPLKKPCRWRFP